VRLALEPVARGRRHLVLRYAVDDLHFSTTYWYDDVDLFELEERGRSRRTAKRCLRRHAPRSTIVT